MSKKCQSRQCLSLSSQSIQQTSQKPVFRVKYHFPNIFLKPQNHLFHYSSHCAEVFFLLRLITFKVKKFLCSYYPDLILQNELMLFYNFLETSGS